LALADGTLKFHIVQGSAAKARRRVHHRAVEKVIDRIAKVTQTSHYEKKDEETKSPVEKSHALPPRPVGLINELVASFANRSNLLTSWENTETCEVSG
jgi:hypothetical protein